MRWASNETWRTGIIGSEAKNEERRRLCNMLSKFQRTRKWFKYRSRNRKYSDRFEIHLDVPFSARIRRNRFLVVLHTMKTRGVRRNFHRMDLECPLSTKWSTPYAYAGVGENLKIMAE